MPRLRAVVPPAPLTHPSTPRATGGPYAVKKRGQLVDLSCEITVGVHNLNALYIFFQM